MLSRARTESLLRTDMKLRCGNIGRALARGEYIGPKLMVPNSLQILHKLEADKKLRCVVYGQIVERQSGAFEDSAGAGALGSCRGE